MNLDVDVAALTDVDLDSIVRPGNDLTRKGLGLKGLEDSPELGLNICFEATRQRHHFVGHGLLRAEATDDRAEDAPKH